MAAKEQPTRAREIVTGIQRQYLQMVPLKYFNWKGAFDELNCSLQKQILQKTYSSPLCSKYAPSVQYQRLFLRQLLNYSEETGDEVVDEVYEAYADIVSKVEEKNVPCYKSYVLPSGTVVTLEESQHIISQGTTGLTTWQASLFMSEWAVENSTIFQDRNILELGCGLGLLGLTISSCSQPLHYLFTDCHELVLTKLQTNLDINGFVHTGTACYCGSRDTRSVAENLSAFDKQHSQGTHLKCSCPQFGGFNSRVTGSRWTLSSNRTAPYTQKYLDVKNVIHNRECLQDHIRIEDVALPTPIGCIKVNCEDCKTQGFLEESTYCEGGKLGHLARNVALVKLDWTEVEDKDLERLSSGVILAADVIYDMDIIKPLVKILYKLLSCAGDGGKPVAFIASTVRNTDTYQLFLNELGKYQIKWIELTRPSLQVFYYDHKSAIKLIRLEV